MKTPDVMYLSYILMVAIALTVAVALLVDAWVYSREMKRRRLDRKTRDNVFRIKPRLEENSEFRRMLSEERLRHRMFPDGDWTTE
ncbi:MAG: hypothetical protein V4447_10790 [Pseudomonadota bacterium]